jgi:RES domain-containing protein
VSITAAFSARTFRVVPPKWAHDPLSGEGARVHGGRYNPPGVAAFYSALDPHTAYAEYTQSLFDRPGLLCAFDVSSARVIDISTNDGLEAAELRPDDLVARWAGRSDAPTQLAAKRLIESGVDGFVYRSLQHQSGFNLVLWLWTKPSPARIRLVDRLGEAVTRPLS